MVQLDLKKIFTAQRETSVLSETVINAGTGDGQATASVNPPVGTPKSLREAKKLWTGVAFCTYNCESLSEARLMQITRELEKNSIDILCLQGTRNKFNGDQHLNGYKIVYEPAGTGKQESYAGVAIVVSDKLLDKTQHHKMTWLENRILALRVKSKFFDHAIISAYAPGDHLPRSIRTRYWQALRKCVNGVPRRSYLLLGTDSNGHVGHDPGPGIGGSGAERWTENGLELQRTCTECHLTALNTLDSCKNTGWTWQRRDGKGVTRIDYLIVSNRLHSQISCNTGVNTCIQLDSQGHGVDHRPVSATFNFRTLHEQGSDFQKEKPTIPGLSNFNRSLAKAFKAYSSFIDNQFRVVPLPVDGEALELAQALQESFANEVNEYWDPAGSVDDKNSLLSRAACNAYTEFLLKKSEKPIRKPYIDSETLLQIDQRRDKWENVRLAATTLTTGWQQTITREYKRLKKLGQILLPTHFPSLFPNRDIPELTTLCSYWIDWKNHNLFTRNEIRNRKIKYQEKLIEEVGAPGSESSIWKAIDRLAPAPKKIRCNNLGVEKSQGGWCYSSGEVINEVRQFATDELWQRDPSDLLPPEPVEVPNSYDDAISPTVADVKASFRKTNPNRSSPPWAPPLKLWVILEDAAAPRFKNIWTQMGVEDTFVKDWETSKCAWIDKPGKKGKNIRDKRGIIIADAAGKSYLTWLQKQCAMDRHGTWKDESMGALPGRSSTQALIKILSVRERLRRNKQNNVTFLGDAVKAFDRINRKKVLDQVTRKIKKPDLVRRIIARHKKVLVKSTFEGDDITMAMTTGVPQGCPKGPPLYVTGYEGVTDDIDEARCMAGHQRLLAKDPFPTSGPPPLISIDRTTYVDDHLEHRILTNGNNFETIQNEIKELVTIIMDSQKGWDIDNNLDKTVVLIDLFGKGARKVLKRLNGSILLDDGRCVKIAKSTKYLGVRIGGHLDSINDDTARISKAGEAMGRLSKFWRSKTLPLSQKIKLYSSLVRSIMTYGLEARLLTTSQLSRLEAAQTRHLRRIGESPAHIEHESNESLRERLHTPTFESWIRKLRLGIWRKLALHPQPAVTGSVLGPLNIDSHECNRERAVLLRNDLIECSKLNKLACGFSWRADNTVFIDAHFWHALACLTKSQIDRTLSFTSSVDRKHTKQTGPARELKHICDVCGSKFGTHAGLQTHKSKTHGVIHPLRSLVTSNICPICSVPLANVRGAQLHVQRVCAPKLSEEQLQALILRISTRATAVDSQTYLLGFLH